MDFEEQPVVTPLVDSQQDAPSLEEGPLTVMDQMVADRDRDGWVERYNSIAMIEQLIKSGQQMEAARLLKKSNYTPMEFFRYFEDYTLAQHAAKIINTDKRQKVKYPTKPRPEERAAKREVEAKKLMRPKIKRQDLVEQVNHEFDEIMDVLPGFLYEVAEVHMYDLWPADRNMTTKQYRDGLRQLRYMVKQMETPNAQGIYSSMKDMFNMPRETWKGIKEFTKAMQGLSTLANKLTAEASEKIGTAVSAIKDTLGTVLTAFDFIVDVIVFAKLVSIDATTGALFGVMKASLWVAKACVTCDAIKLNATQLLSWMNQLIKSTMPRAQGPKDEGITLKVLKFFIGLITGNADDVELLSRAKHIREIFGAINSLETFLTKSGELVDKILTWIMDRWSGKTATEMRNRVLSLTRDLVEISNDHNDTSALYERAKLVDKRIQEIDLELLGQGGRDHFFEYRKYCRRFEVKFALLRGIYEHAAPTKIEAIGLICYSKPGVGKNTLHDIFWRRVYMMAGIKCENYPSLVYNMPIQEGAYNDAYNPTEQLTVAVDEFLGSSDDKKNIADTNLLVALVGPSQLQGNHSEAERKKELWFKHRAVVVGTNAKELPMNALHQNFGGALARRYKFAEFNTTDPRFLAEGAWKDVSQKDLETNFMRYLEVTYGPCYLDTNDNTVKMKQEGKYTYLEFCKLMAEQLKIKEQRYKERLESKPEPVPEEMLDLLRKAEDREGMSMMKTYSKETLNTFRKLLKDDEKGERKASDEMLKFIGDKIGEFIKERLKLSVDYVYRENDPLFQGIMEDHMLLIEFLTDYKDDFGLLGIKNLWENLLRITEGTELHRKILEQYQRVDAQWLGWILMGAYSAAAGVFTSWSTERALSDRSQDLTPAMLMRVYTALERGLVYLRIDGVIIPLTRQRFVELIGAGGYEVCKWLELPGTDYLMLSIEYQQAVYDKWGVGINSPASFEYDSDDYRDAWEQMLVWVTWSAKMQYKFFDLLSAGEQLAEMKITTQGSQTLGIWKRLVLYDKVDRSFDDRIVVVKQWSLWARAYENRVDYTPAHVESALLVRSINQRVKDGFASISWLTRVASGAIMPAIATFGCCLLGWFASKAISWIVGKLFAPPEFKLTVYDEHGNLVSERILRAENKNYGAAEVGKPQVKKVALPTAQGEVFAQMIKTGAKQALAHMIQNYAFVEMTSVLETGEVFSIPPQRILFLKGRIFVIPYHVIKYFMDRPHKNTTMSISMVSYKSAIFSLADCALKRIQYKDELYNPGVADLVLVRAPARYIQPKQKIIQHFISEKELTEANLLYNIKLVEVDSSSQYAVVKIRDLEGTRILESELKSRATLPDGSEETFVTSRVVEYRAATSGGTCMAVAVIDSDKVTGPVIGPHLAGAGDGRAFAAITPREFWNRMLEGFDDDPQLPLRDFGGTNEVIAQGSIWPQLDQLPVTLPENTLFYDRVPKELGHHMNNKSRIKRTPLFPDGVTEKRPADLSIKSDERPSALQKIMDKKGDANRKLANPFRSTVVALQRERYLQAKPVTPIKLGEKEFLEGCTSDPNGHPVRLNTSSGAFMKNHIRGFSGKNRYIQLDGDHKKFTQAGREALEALKKDLEVGIVPEVLTDNMKDELRLNHKVDDRSTRCFEGSQLVYSEQMYEYFGAFFAAAKAGAFYTNIVVGQNPTSGWWGTTVSRLRSGKRNLLQGDFERNDIRMYSEDRYDTLTVIDAWYDKYDTSDDETKRKRKLIRSRLWTGRVNFMTIIGDTIYQNDHRLASGQIFTSEEGSMTRQRTIMGAIAVLLASYYPTAANNLLNNANKFYDMFPSIQYGDDGAWGIPPEFPKINFPNVAKVVSDLHFVNYTLPSKDDRVVVDYQPWEDFDFLSRGDKEIDGMHYAALRTATIKEIPYWRNDDGVPDDVRCIELCDAALSEWYHHGEEVFNQWKATYDSELEKHRYGKTTLSYQKAHHDWLGNY